MIELGVDESEVDEDKIEVEAGDHESTQDGSSGMRTLQGL